MSVGSPTYFCGFLGLNFPCVYCRATALSNFTALYSYLISLMAINPYAFIKSNGLYTFYKNGQPVVHDIIDPTIDKQVYTDSEGVKHTVFLYTDHDLYQYMKLESKGSKETQKNNTSREAVASPYPLEPTEEVSVKKNEQAKHSSEQATSGVMQTPQQGYGNVPDRNKVNELTQNTGMYGGGVTNLVYPSDLITNKYGYNGCYTVFFITEHEEATIAKAHQNTDKKYIESAETSDVLQLAQNDKEFADWVMKGAGLFAGAGVGGLDLVQSVATFIGKSVGAAKVFSLSAVGAGAVAGATSAIAEANSDLKQMKVAIALPTPVLTDSHRMVWDSQSAMFGAGLMQVGAEIFGAAKGWSQDGAQAAAGDANSSAGRAFEMAMSGIEASALHGMSQSGLGSTLTRMVGKTANTRKEAIFQDVDMREFQMSFQMAARSTEDMKNIESIIRVLKYHAYPELTANNFMWIYPALFDIVHYYRDDINYHMPRHATSVLKSITVDYSNGNGAVSVHHDGSPVLIKLDLSFMEITQLNRGSIAKGY